MKQRLGDIYFDKLNIKDIKKLLVELDNKSLNQIMLEIYRERSLNVIPSEVLKKYISNSEFFGPSSLPLKKTILYNLKFFNSLPCNYEDVDVSVINPFAINSSITNLSQNLVLSTIKNSEICGDPTTALTLEAAKRRKKYMLKEDTISKEVNLATVTRVLRMQPFDKSKGYMQHFNLFGMVSSGRKNNELDFNILKIQEHISVWLDFCIALENFGFNFGKIEVGITTINLLKHLVKYKFIDRRIITENSLNDEFDILRDTNIKLPSRISSYLDFDKNTIEKYNLYYLKKEFDTISNVIIAELSKKYPNVNFYIDLSRKAGLGYYSGICFHIYSDVDSNIIQLADGGISDWNTKLLSDKKELLVTSGFGAELILKLYGKDISAEDLL